MDSFVGNLTAHLKIHGLPLLLPFAFVARGERRAWERSRGSRLIREKSDLTRVQELIRTCQPDLVALNEVAYPFHRFTLDRFLRSQGFTAIAWGSGSDYKDVTASTVLASRLPANPQVVRIPMEAHFGGGGGAVALRLIELPVTLVACHLAVRARFPELFRRQVDDLVSFGLAERRIGRQVAFTGDWNSGSHDPFLASLLSTLGLKNATPDVRTCPTYLPFGWSLDHIFIPREWSAAEVAVTQFGSDHVALSASIDVPLCTAAGDPFAEPGMQPARSTSAA